MCDGYPTNHPLSLLDVVGLALCTQKAGRKAWAKIAEATAELGLARANYWPVITGTVPFGYNRSYINAPDDPFYNFDIQSKNHGWELDANWSLYDFGATQKKVSSAKFSLISAIANRDAAVQTVALSASQAFYDVIAAEAQVAANQQAEAYALESLTAATERYRSGLAAVTDRLQAQTEYSAAKIKTISAEGDLRNASGALCVTIGADVTSTLTLDTSDNPVPSTDTLASIEKLLEEAQRNNPDLRAARATAYAAYENYKATTVDDLPKLSLVGSTHDRTQKSVSSNNTVSFVAQPPDHFTRDRSVELRLTIPLFSGFSHRNKVNEARALVQEADIELNDSERQVSLQVWKAYQALQTDVQSYIASSELVSNAMQSSTASKERYHAGMGTVVDMLSAQSALAAAESQRLVTLANWRSDTVKLAAATGRLAH